MKSIQLEDLTYDKLLKQKLSLSQKRNRVIDFNETVRILLDKEEEGGGMSGDSQ